MNDPVDVLIIGAAASCRSDISRAMPIGMKDQGWLAAPASSSGTLLRGSAEIRCAAAAPAEVQITKLKLVKRQMYGRAKLDLLRARLLAPT
jgi:hypothetical protein